MNQHLDVVSVERLQEMCSFNGYLQRSLAEISCCVSASKFENHFRAARIA